jgi:hypothetical protein
MSKKVAILIGGMLREFETAHKSWTFLNHDNRDVFFSTWDTTCEINEPLGINIKEKVTEENIKNYIPDAHVKLSKDLIFDLTTVSSIKKIIYHWKILLAMVKETGNTYDTAVLTRPDFFIKENTDLVKFINDKSDNFVYGLTNAEKMDYFPYYYTQDCFFIAKYSIIEKMIETLELHPDTDDIHVYLAKYFLDNKIHVIRLEPTVLEYYVCRSIHKKTLDLSFEENKKLGIEWWHIKNTKGDPTNLLKILKGKKLFLFGDSFTAGNGALPIEEYTLKYKTENDSVWPEIVAKELGLTLVNYGMGLFSNDKILDVIMLAYDEISEGDTVIIGKTFPFRVDIPDKTDTQLLTLAPNHFTSIQNRYSKEEIEHLNHLLVILDSPLMKFRHDFRFDFFKKLLESKRVKQVILWEVSDLCHSFETIQTATNFEIQDTHWSFKGHKDFAEYILRIIKRSLI